MTIENLGSTTVQPGYARTVGWANGLATPALGFDPSIATVETTADGQALRLEVGVASIEPGASQAFRLYFGAGASADEANAGLSVNNASVVSQTNLGTTGFVFAYAQGYPSVTAGSDGSGGGGGNGSGARRRRVAAVATAVVAVVAVAADRRTPSMAPCPAGTPG